MKNGFTLVELLITVAILAAVAVVGGINLFSYYSRQNLELTTEEIIALIRDAQNRSLTQQDGNSDGQGDQWGIHFENRTADPDWTRLFCCGPSYASGTIVSTHNLRMGIQLTDPSEGNSKDIIFSKVTGYPNAFTSILVALKNDSTVSYIITINKIGQVTSASGLVANALAQWKLNDNAATTLIVDSAGSYNMALLGGKKTSDISIVGKINNAFTFIDGVSVGSLGDQANLRLNEFSVAGWIKRRMYNASTYTKQAESYITGIGQATTYLSRASVLAAASSGAGYCVEYSFLSTDFGNINFYPNVAIDTKGSNTLLYRTELYKNSVLIKSSDVYSNGFTAAQTWYQGYQVTNNTFSNFVTEADATLYSWKIYSYGNQDFYVDAFQFDVYHNSPVGKSNDWAFWGNGTSFRVQIGTGSKSAYASASNVPQNQWTFIVGTFSKNNQRVRIWTNATLRATTPTGGDLSPTWTAAPIYIGGKSSSGNSLFYGDVDNVVFFNKELTQAEITALYNNSLGKETF